ncbi:hypothetical protein K7X08_035202 [Anisodus acutangulus]|uniref:Uncharacterized protein n=1 Tax=Anisodus acutangulus TaxID=402998 RepID=A0A9Q1LK87_9SOLA|nr:hypothetical protein K7X08_035202 [Anisodus acutangulus]
MKKRKMPCDDTAVNMQWGFAQNHVAAESCLSTMNPAAYHPHCSGMQYMSYGHHHVLPEESFRGQYVETRKADYAFTNYTSALVFTFCNV